MTLAFAFACLQAPPQVSFDERLLSVLPDGAQVTDVLFSPDGRYVTYRVQAGGKAFVMVNKEKGPVMDRVLDPPRFGPDGRTVFYRGQVSGRCCVVEGVRRGELFDLINTPVMSPDGKKLGYTAGGRGSWSAVVGGRQFGGNYMRAGDLVFNSTGTSWAFPARITKKGTATRPNYTMDILILDGKPGPEFERIESVVFAPDGKTVAYKVSVGIDVGASAQWFMLEGTKRHEIYRSLGPPRYTADGRLVYTACSTEGKHYVVVDGSRGEAYDGVGPPVFSPDGRSIAFTASKDGKSFVVVNGKLLEGYTSVMDPVFSPDGRAVAYAACDRGRWRMVTGDKPGDTLEFIGAPVWSPDGTRVAYPAMWKTKFVMVLGNERTELYEAVGPPAWSPDGTRAAHAAKKLTKWSLVIHHRRNDEGFDEIYGAPVFSPDGRKVAFGARKGNDLLWKVYPVPE